MNEVEKTLYVGRRLVEPKRWSRLLALIMFVAVSVAGVTSGRFLWTVFESKIEHREAVMADYYRFQADCDAKGGSVAFVKGRRTCVKEIQ